MKVLITGGCGFVGSSIATYLQAKYPQWEITVFDNLRRKGSELNLQRLGIYSNIKFVHGDIRHEDDLRTAGHADLIIEASAEPSVLAGIGSPNYTIDTNLVGTIHALNLARSYNATFLFLSTSRVYPINQVELIRTHEAATRFVIDDKQDIPGISPKGISEKFPIDGYRSIYGATKLASEIMIQEYHHFFGLKTIVNRCGVLTGPWQMGKVDQGVAVLWMARHFWKKPLSYIGFEGSGKQVRDILHVMDLCELVDEQINDIERFNGKVFNVGGGAEGSVSLREMTRLCQEISGNVVDVTPVTENRQADIKLYVTDNTLINSACGWKPRYQPRKIFEEIFEWIRANEKTLTPILK